MDQVNGNSTAFPNSRCMSAFVSVFIRVIVRNFIILGIFFNSLFLLLCIGLIYGLFKVIEFNSFSIGSIIINIQLILKGIETFCQALASGGSDKTRDLFSSLSHVVLGMLYPCLDVQLQP